MIARSIFVAAGFAALLLGCKFQTTETTTAPAVGAEAVRVGNTMPSYAADDLDGKRVELTSLRDRVVLVNIWATWCGPCRAEIPDLIRLQQKYASRGLTIVGVSIDQADAKETVKSFVADQKINYPVWLDAEARIATMFETNVVPTSALVDRKGKILWLEQGVVDITNPKLLAALETAL